MTPAMPSQEWVIWNSPFVASLHGLIAKKNGNKCLHVGYSIEYDSRMGAVKGCSLKH